MGAEAAIARVRDVTYWYPSSDAPAVQGVDLELAPGEFVLLVGESGSGKSTLLRALNGLVPRYHGGRMSGRVEVAGLRTDRSRVSELARHVGLVFQDPERQAVMARVDNEVAFGLECLGRPPDGIGPAVEAALAAVGLGDRAGSMVAQLSSGQGQRLALAAVMAMEPALIALDEPTSQLDPVAAGEFVDNLVRQRRRTGATVVVAEHRLERFLPIADRVVELSAGRVTYDGPPGGYLERLGAPKQGAPPPDGRGEVLVRCEGLRFSYAGTGEVLRGADIALRAGEVLALVGPNGSGKTTMARHLNGLLRPSSGRVEVGGNDASGLSVADLSREVALLTQNPGDYLFERTVGAELSLTASFRGLEGTAAQEAVSRTSERLGLGPHMGSFSWDLSAGQRQRVALGALLVGAPRVLVLDEPTRGMDRSHKEELARIAREQAAAGGAVLLITHDTGFAALAANSYAVMEGGRVVDAGPPEEVLGRRPEYAPVDLEEVMRRA